MRICLLAIVPLLWLASCGQEPERQAEPIRVQIVDADGEPATWARVLLHVRDQNVVSKWDADRALLILPRESAPHGVMLSAEGHRRLIVKNITDDRTITLPKGLIVRIDAQTAVQVPEPRAILMRIRPWVPGDPDKDAAASRRITQICDLMFLVKGQEQGSLPILPTAHWGYGVSPTDARNGIYVPEPGSYVVHWGLLDLDEGTWYTIEEGAVMRFEVKDRAEPQTFKLAIDEATMQATDAALQERIEEIRSAEDAAKKDDEKK